MARPFRVLASCRSPTTLEAVQGAVREVGGAQLEAYNGALADVVKSLGPRSRIDVMLLEVDLANDSELEVLSDVIDHAPAGVPIIATSNNASLDRVRLLMRLGLVDFVPQPILHDDLLNSLAVARRQLAHQAPTQGGRVITFMRAAGGMGATTLAVQSACILAQEQRKERRTCLIDLDIQGQAVALHLNIDSPFSLADCLAEPQRIDAMLMKSIVTHHKSGFDVLPAPKITMPLERVQAAAVDAMLEVARDQYDFILLDTPPLWTSWVDDVVANTDLLILVTQMTVPGIRRARRQLGTLAERNFGAVPTLVVANRYQKRMFRREITLPEAEQALGRKIDACIPSDYRVVSEALNSGVPISSIKRQTKIEKAVRGLMKAALRELEKQAPAEQAARRPAN
jgi:pilus assembly protein CpaE